VEVDVDAAYVVQHEQMKTRVGWTPFAGMPVRGKMMRVVLRGETLFAEGKLLAKPGSGKVLFGGAEGM
jgi:carbamoyl-phosphate synthase/aspartate carbamoyltransferase/dihydroorotase